MYRHSTAGIHTYTHFLFPTDRKATYTWNYTNTDIQRDVYIISTHFSSISLSRMHTHKHSHTHTNADTRCHDESGMAGLSPSLLLPFIMVNLWMSWTAYPSL